MNHSSLPVFIPDSPVVAQWYDAAQTILHIVHSPEWTWKDVYRHDQEVIVPALRQFTYPIALICDFRAAPLMPPRDFAQNVKRSAALYEPLQIDIVVFTLVQTSIATLLETAHRHYSPIDRVYTSALTADEAAQRIYKIRG